MEKRTRVFLRRLLFAGASRSPCLPCATIVECHLLLQITAKTQLHRPSILNSLSEGVCRLYRIILIFGSSIPHVAFSRKYDATPARVKAPFADRFSAQAAFPAPAPPSPPPFALEQRARFISRTTRSHIERSTAPFPRREYCFPSNNNRDVETYLLLHVRATITTPGSTKSGRTKQTPLAKDTVL